MSIVNLEDVTLRKLTKLIDSVKEHYDLCGHNDAKVWSTYHGWIPLAEVRNLSRSAMIDVIGHLLELHHKEEAIDTALVVAFARHGVYPNFSISDNVWELARFYQVTGDVVMRKLNHRTGKPLGKV
jgi:hypothetical protein